MSESPRSVLELLDEIRAIALNGIHYARDPYDLERYERLLAAAGREYAPICALPGDDLIARFRTELGQVTPKVGLDAAIFDSGDRLLITRRADDGLWCLPCGWAEVGESPEEGIQREVREETGFEVIARGLIGVFHRRPGEFGRPHSVYILLYHCEVTGPAAAAEMSEGSGPEGTRVLDRTGGSRDEVIEWRYADPTEVDGWHCDHRERAIRAVEHRRSGR